MILIAKVARKKKSQPSLFLHLVVNSVRYKKYFVSFKLTAIADDNLNMDGITRVGCERIENIVGKETMLITSIFSFPIM